MTDSVRAFVRSSLVWLTVGGLLGLAMVFLPGRSGLPVRGGPSPAGGGGR